MTTRPIKTNSRDVLGLAETRPLPHKEILALFAQWRDNDDLSARDQIVGSNMRFAAQIAHEYVDTCSLNLDELISEGIQGFVMAAEWEKAIAGAKPKKQPNKKKASN
jgi:DNA-directed RNA polymerase sigma subunit (sigma70/sigma32)